MPKHGLQEKIGNVFLTYSNTNDAYSSYMLLSIELLS